VANILIYSNNPHLTAHWNHALTGDHSVNRLTNVSADFTADLVLVDAQKLEDNESLYALLKKGSGRFLVVGNNWNEQKQIDVVVKGAAGYCEASENAEIVKRAVNSILNGDLWVQRCLVPKIILALTTIRRSQGASVKSSNLEQLLTMFDSLSVREMEVAQMIQIGESNKRIASEMNISERTVKAHLSSIFRKLEVEDRLQLAIFLKEIEQYRKSA
jgi:DNA-binding NarL/FixJ family response regulator